MRLRYNGLRAALDGAIDTDDTAVTFAAALTHSGGTAVPTISGGDYIPLSILDSDGVLAEIVWLTAYTSAGTSGTITRGMEGTSGANHSDGAVLTNAPTIYDFADARDWNTDQVPVDEFDDGVLSGWTAVDKSGGSSRVSWTERNGALLCATAGGDSTAELHAQVRSISSMSVGDGFVTACRLVGVAANFVIGGIVIADGNASGAGGQVQGIYYLGGSTSANVAKLGTDAFTNYQTEDAGGIAADQTLSTAGGRLIIRTALVSSNTWRTDWSLDGSLWVLGSATKSKTITPAYAGVVASSWGTSTKGLVQYDYFRRVSGVS